MMSNDMKKKTLLHMMRVLTISLSCWALLLKTTAMHLMRHPGLGKPVTMTLTSRISEKMLEYKNTKMVLLRPRQEGYVPHHGEDEYHTGSAYWAFGSWCPLFCRHGSETNDERMDPLKCAQVSPWEIPHDILLQ